MNIEELKKRCLDSIEREKQFEKARNLAEDRPIEFYHRGRKEVWLDIHDVLVRWF